jgi:hypothetical protein
MDDNILSLIFTQGETSSINRTFHLIDLCEEVIAEQKEKYPDKADLVDKAFGLSRPSDIFNSSIADNLYKAHVRELCERLALEGDTRFPTCAEVCIAMSEISQRAPIATDAALAYMQAFVKALPDSTVSTEIRPRMEELQRSFCSDPVLTEIYSKLKQEWRKL